jgi:hypothetical protein
MPSCICNQHKAFPVGEAIRGLEVVSIALDVVGLAVTILVPQQRQISGRTDVMVAMAADDRVRPGFLAAGTNNG